MKLPYVLDLKEGDGSAWIQAVRNTVHYKDAVVYPAASSDGGGWHNDNGRMERNVKGSSYSIEMDQVKDDGRASCFLDFSIRSGIELRVSYDVKNEFHPKEVKHLQMKAAFHMDKDRVPQGIVKTKCNDVLDAMDFLREVVSEELSGAKHVMRGVYTSTGRKSLQNGIESSMYERNIIYCALFDQHWVAVDMMVHYNDTVASLDGMKKNLFKCEISMHVCSMLYTSNSFEFVKRELTLFSGYAMDGSWTGMSPEEIQEELNHRIQASGSNPESVQGQSADPSNTTAGANTKPRSLVKRLLGSVGRRGTGEEACFLSCTECGKIVLQE